MPLLKGGRFVQDGWRELAHGEAVPPTSGRVVIPFARLAGEAEALAAFEGELGVRLEPKERVEGLEPWLPRLGLVALSFPAFGDGRALSAARILRQRYRFAGEVRAVGEVLVDQHQFMRQCGFDAFEITGGRALAGWRGAEAVWRARRAVQALAAE
jgi:uncharacterized protein (DUF934 family)